MGCAGGKGVFTLNYSEVPNCKLGRDMDSLRRYQSFGVIYGLGGRSFPVGVSGVQATRCKLLITLKALTEN